MKRTIYLIIFAIAISSAILYNGIDSLIAKYISMCLFGFLFIVSLFKAQKQRYVSKIFYKWVVLLMLAFFSNLLLAYDQMPIPNLLNTNLAIQLMVAFSAYNLFDVKRENLPLYMFPICIFAAYCACYSVISGLGGLHISEIYDDNIAKNQIGAAFTTFAIISAVFTIEGKNIFLKIIYCLLSVISLYPALCFTCRTALLSYALVVIFLIFQYYRWKGMIILPIIIFILAFWGGDELRGMLYDSIIGNRDVNDFDEMSSGRVTHAVLSLNYFSRHPLFGFYGSGDGWDLMPPNVHIFLLYRLTKWGIVGSIPFIALYFSIFKILLDSIKDNDLLLIGVLLLPFIESFSEYAAPFGPGSCFTVSFVLIGYYLRNNSQISQNYK